jgi:subfamily B ATP-binding cassette protein MsbA
MTATSETQAEPSARQTALRMFREYLRPQLGRLIAALLCAVAVALLTAFLIWILGPVIKKVLIQKRMDSLLLIVPLIVIGGLLRGGFQIAQAQLVNRLGHGIVGRMQARLFSTLMHADLARLREQHSGAYVSSVLYDANLIREGLTTGVVNMTQQSLQVVALVGVMLFQDAYLTVLVLVAAPVASLVMQRYARRTRSAAEGAMAETSVLSTAVMENLDGIKIVKIDNREAFEEARVAEVIERRQRHIIKGANARAAAAPATETLTTLVTAAVIAYAGWRAVHGALSVDQIFVFLGSLAAAGQALRQVANLQSVIAEGLVAARRLFAALDVKVEVGDAPGAESLVMREGRIRFEQVSFGYSASAPALSDVSLDVARGETVALVGPSGGGKSTILNLIPRFYDVTAGRVLIDGQDIRGVTQSSLRSQIALVTQEPFLFDDTLRANIAYARPDASDAEVEAAARAAAAHDFIATLPNGYDTNAGEAGARLSGGQRQRISIARAFLKNAPILLLDEATSALDTESERKVQEALERLMAGRTTLMIAHRLSTVRGADRIYVVEAGRVVEQGNHASLMAAEGLYARLARAQNLDVTPSLHVSLALGDAP